jgi:hypothetical protein
MKTLEQKIMPRVRRIYYLRKLTGPTALKAYALGALAVWLASLVSVVNVLTNMPSVMTPVSLVRFLASAALQTEVAVQALLLGVGILVALMVRDIARNTKDEQQLFAHG